MLPDESVSIFIQPPLPGCIGMGKIDVGSECLRNFLVFGKLQAIVISDGVNPASVRSKCLFDALTQRYGLFGFRFS